MEFFNKILKEGFSRLDAIHSDLINNFYYGMEIITRSTSKIIIKLPNNKFDVMNRNENNFDFTIEISLGGNWKPRFRYANTERLLKDAEYTQIFSIKASLDKKASVLDIIEEQLKNIAENGTNLESSEEEKTEEEKD